MVVKKRCNVVKPPARLHVKSVVIMLTRNKILRRMSLARVATSLKPITKRIKLYTTVTYNPKHLVYSTASFLAEGSEEIDGDVVIGVSVIHCRQTPLTTYSDSL